MNVVCSRIAPSAARGFSLIELLATVGIVVTLAALIMPAYRTMLGRRDAAVCLSNLRQTYSYYINEVQDNDMTIPLSYDYVKKQGWVDKVQETLGSTWQSANGGTFDVSFLGCPAERKKLHYGGNRRTLGINKALTDDANVPTAADGVTKILPKFAMFQKPSKTILLADAALKSPTSVDAGFSNSSDKLPDPVHFGSANTLFMDGHATSMTSKELTAMLGTPKGDGSDISVFWIGR